MISSGQDIGPDSMYVNFQNESTDLQFASLNPNDINQIEIFYTHAMTAAGSVSCIFYSEKVSRSNVLLVHTIRPSQEFQL